MGIEIKLAETPEEKDAIFRLRYKIYVEEMKISLHADHEQRKIVDFLDKNGNLFYAKTNGDIVATGRVNFGKDSPLELESEYEMERFGEYYPNKVSTTTRFMIEPEYRGSTVASRLIKELYNFGQQGGTEFDFINISPNNYQFYRHMGYREYAKNFHHEAWGECIPLVLVMNDAKYLTHCKSPFSRIVPYNPDKQKEIDKFVKKNNIHLI